MASVVEDMTASDVFAVRTYAEEIYLGYPLGGGFAPIVPGPLGDVVPYRFPWEFHQHLWANAALAASLSLGLAWGTRVGRRLTFEPRLPATNHPLNWVVGGIGLVMIAALLFVPASYLIQQAGRVVSSGPMNSTPVVAWRLAAAIERCWQVPWRLRYELGYSIAISAGGDPRSALSANPRGPGSRTLGRVWS
ncbi:MAG: hypothetical protein R3B96_19950 [Pirellulaceae bacterium]